MALQFVLGPSGAGKSYTVYQQMIAEAMEHPSHNFILLVPEQYSLALQRKLVQMHPNKGTMNIDVIGFNRLTYRIFDELQVTPGHVLEDFGKTMLIRQIAEQVKDSLSVYSGCLSRAGFIDEVKSLMSEMYQYDLSRERLNNVLEKLKDVASENLLYRKLLDMKTIFEAFDERLSGSYIVAEQLTELLASLIPRSSLIKNSTIVMDGFTGFTPIQRKVVRGLLAYACDVRVILTIDRQSYEKERLPEHALFYLTRETMDYLKADARECQVEVAEDIFIDGVENSRWKGDALKHLEQNIFRYPYQTYEHNQENIFLTSYDNPMQEICGVAEQIHSLVREHGYRYRDIAVISGNLEQTIGYAERLLPMYQIPYFLDYSRPVKNNPYIDAIEHLLALCADNFSYDSMFAFLKSGVLDEISYDDIEMLENYVLASGMRGASWWKKELSDGEIEPTRAYVMEIVLPFYEAVTAKNITVSNYVQAIYDLFQAVRYEEKLAGYPGLYERICDLLEKMLEVMTEDVVTIDTFSELLKIGLSDLSLGMIPNSLDSIIVGDITRTRLDDIRVLFIIGVNDGVIPKKTSPAQIISDREKERLSEYSFVLAPTEKVNAYIEQFYLYINMTKPADKLYLSYTQLSGANEVMRPSYIIGRIKNLYPKLQVLYAKETEHPITTSEAGVQILILGLQALMNGDNSRAEQTLALYRLYLESEDTALVARIQDAMEYSNIPKQLTEEVAALVRVKLLSQSVSKLEKYAQCAYAFFLQYALGLRERGIKQIDRRNNGLILHSALESLYRHVHDNMDNAWDTVSEAFCDDLMERFVTEAFADEYGEQWMEDARYEHLQNVLVRIGKRTVGRLIKLGNKDLLLPEFFEYKFKKEIALDSMGETMTLMGVVDRGDVYYDSHANEIKLRVIDYKSGNRDFKINELYEGLQLQLSIYMDVMEELVADQYKQQGNTDACVVPDGMYYYQMKDPFVDAENEEDAEAKRDKQFVYKGLKQTDEEYFKTITGYAHKKVKELAETMLTGKMDKAPMVRGNTNACQYCSYADVCRFDEQYGGNHYRYLRYKDSEKDLVYEKMQSELGGV